MGKDMAGPLMSLRVVDLSQMLAGPSAGLYLADLGAEVIKVEPPGGDRRRFMGNGPFLSGHSKASFILNRNKRSIVVDVTRAHGQEIVHRLIQRSDVIIVDFRTGVAERLGADYATLTALNPRLIYARITGYGSMGAETYRKGYDLLLQARAGILYGRRDSDGMPIIPLIAACDMAAPILLAYGVAAALLEREHSGMGQVVETSLLDAAIAMQCYEMVAVDGEPVDSGLGASLYRGVFRCADGEYLYTSTLTDTEWASLCRTLGLEHLIRDPKFSDYAKRASHRSEVYLALQAVFDTKPCKEWLERLKAADVAAEAVVPRGEVFQDRQVLANQSLIEVEHPQAGKVTFMGWPVKLSRTPPGLRRLAPEPGEHTAEVLMELGYTREEISRLTGARVIGGKVE